MPPPAHSLSSIDYRFRPGAAAKMTLKNAPLTSLLASAFVD
jgi:hypothetical protein